MDKPVWGARYYPNEPMEGMKIVIDWLIIF